MISIVEFLAKKHLLPTNEYDLPSEFDNYIVKTGNKVHAKGWLLFTKEKPSLLMKVWKALKEEGPMSKEDVLNKLQLKPTSYITSFTDWSTHNVIVRKGGKCYPLDIDNWEENR